MYFTIILYSVVYTLPNIIAFATEKLRFWLWFFATIVCNSVVFWIDAYLQSIGRSVLHIDLSCTLAVFASQFIFLILIRLYAAITSYANQPNTSRPQ